MANARFSEWKKTDILMNMNDTMQRIREELDELLEEHDHNLRQAKALLRRNDDIALRASELRKDLDELEYWQMIEREVRGR